MSTSVEMSATVDGERVTASVTMDTPEAWLALQADLGFGGDMSVFILSTMVSNLVARSGADRTREMLGRLVTFAARVVVTEG